MRTKLMVPGPVDVDGEVLLEMARPMEAHYGPEWAKLHWETVEMAKEVFLTRNDLFVIVGSGTAAIEAAIGSAIGGGARPLVVVNGGFGERLLSVAGSYTPAVETLHLPDDRPIPPEAVDEALRRDPGIGMVAVVHCETMTSVLNPIKEIGEVCRRHDVLFMVDAVSTLGGAELKADEWGIDLCATGSQKCLGAPPGLGLVSVSERAWRVISEGNGPGWYLNLNVWRDYAKRWEDWHPFPITMAVPAFKALKRSLEMILEEGMEATWERHRRTSALLREGIRRLGLRTFVPDEWASPTVTSILPPGGIPPERIVEHIERKHRIRLAGGIGKYEGKVFRVGHMGPAAKESRMAEVLWAIEDALSELGR